MNYLDEEYEITKSLIRDVSGQISTLPQVTFEDVDPNTAEVFRGSGGVFVIVLADPPVQESGMSWLGVEDVSQYGAYWGYSREDCLENMMITCHEAIPDENLTEMFRMLLTTYKL